MNTMPLYKHDLAGVAETVRLGTRGNEIQSNGVGGIFDLKQFDGSAAGAAGAEPIGLQDFVNLEFLTEFLKTQGTLRVSGEIAVDPAGLAAGSDDEIRIVTTAAGGTVVGDIYRYDADDAAWNEITPAEGQTMISNMDYGDFQADHMYVWDFQTTSWSDVGPISIPGAVAPTDTATLSYNTPGDSVTVNSQTLVAGTVLEKLVIEIVDAYDGTGHPSATFVEIGGVQLGSLDDLIDLQNADSVAGINGNPKYEVELSYVMDGAGDVVVSHGVLAGGETAGSAKITLYYQGIQDVAEWVEYSNGLYWGGATPSYFGPNEAASSWGWAPTNILGDVQAWSYFGSQPGDNLNSGVSEPVKGTWVQGFRPTHVKVSFANINRFLLYDTGGNVIAQWLASGYDPGNPTETAGNTETLDDVVIEIDWSNGLDLDSWFMGYHYNEIYKIEFLGG